MIRWLLNHLRIIRKVLEPFLIDLKLIIQDRLIFSLLLLFFDRPTDRPRTGQEDRIYSSILISCIHGNRDDAGGVK